MKIKFDSGKQVGAALTFEEDEENDYSILFRCWASLAVRISVRGPIENFIFNQLKNPIMETLYEN